MAIYAGFIQLVVNVSQAFAGAWSQVLKTFLFSGNPNKSI